MVKFMAPSIIKKRFGLWINHGEKKAPTNNKIATTFNNLYQIFLLSSASCLTTGSIGFSTLAHFKKAKSAISTRRKIQYCFCRKKDRAKNNISREESILIVRLSLFLVSINLFLMFINKIFKVFFFNAKMKGSQLKSLKLFGLDITIDSPFTYSEIISDFLYG